MMRQGIGTFVSNIKNSILLTAHIFDNSFMYKQKCISLYINSYGNLISFETEYTLCNTIISFYDNWINW